MSHTEDTTTIKVGEEPVNSYKLYPRNEEFAKRAGGNTGSQSGGGSVPKPLTYDYMPEGYPKKAVGTVTVMVEQEVKFSSKDDPVYYGRPAEPFDTVEGKTYTVSWDGTEYECVCSVFQSVPMLGNLSDAGVGNDTGEPFLYSKSDDRGIFATYDTSAIHTISVKTTEETVTPMEEEFLPATALITYDLDTNTYSSDLTYDELYTRLLNGKQIVLYTTDGNEYVYLTRWQKLSSGKINLAFAGKDYSVRLNTDGTIVKKPLE